MERAAAAAGPAGLEDQINYGMFRLILEDLAQVGAAQTADVLDFLAAVDRVPVAQRAVSVGCCWRARGR